MRLKIRKRGNDLLSHFFIVRPIFAWVIAIVIMLAGTLAIFSLPVSQYPNIALPQVSVSASYPGASAKNVEDGVTQILEQAMTGLDGLKYMSSQSSNGRAFINLVFEAGTNPDTAQVQVQNKVQTRLRSLPQEVQTQGVQVNKSNDSVFMVATFYTDDNSLTNDDLGDFIFTKIQDPISRIDGIGATRIFGSQHAMRVWLNPSSLQSYSLTPTDILNAIRAQNAQIASGSLADLPATKDASFSAIITAQSRLQTAQEFENIIIKNDPNGTPILLKDVAKVEIGADSYGTFARLNGKEAAGLAMFLASGANALSTADKVNSTLKSLEDQFPDKVKFAIPNDSTQFVKISIEEVVKTLIEAVILVFIVMFMFLQSWRATLIPAIAVPVVLLGTFGILALFGFSINMLTMFGIVLAIGLLVDDAIVVVENVERLMHEEGLSPFEATQKSMDSISGALIGVASVLAAMFVPMAFFGGTQGVIYRQFSVTLISAMGLSVLVALVLTPPLCALLLKPPKPKTEKKQTFTPLTSFNNGFEKFSLWYQNSVRWILKKSKLFMVFYALIIAAMGYLAINLPTSFIPTEDQGLIVTQVQLPVGSTFEQTKKVITKVQDFYLKQEHVRFVFANAGQGGSVSNQNQGQVFTRMKPFEERKTKDAKVFALVEKAKKEFSKYNEANINPSVPPSIRELGNASGFTIVIKDIEGLGQEALKEAKNQFMSDANANPNLSNIRTNTQDDAPQLKVDIDYKMAGALGVPLSEINALMATALGGTYVNDFIDKGRVKRVHVQGDAQYRMRPQDLNLWYVRNQNGDMVPFSAFSTSRFIAGPQRLERYNGSPSIEIQGQAAEGISDGIAMTEVEQIAKSLPQGISYEWTGLSLQEKETGQQAPALYAISVIFIFLLLAALYESWSVPFAVILILPLGVLGALLATYIRGLDNDIFFQVGLLATMGLSAKNAILIVEFARTLHEQGQNVVAATLEAVRVRLRPIIMTSLAFTFGIFPLVIASSAGAKAQNSIGTGLFGGILSATFLAIFFVPLFFVLVQNLFDKTKKDVKNETHS